MSSIPPFPRLVELKSRYEQLKKEAESCVLNIGRLVAEGNLLYTFLESITEIERFLRVYPDIGAEFDFLINNLVKINCYLEIALSKKSDIYEHASSHLNNTLTLSEWNPLCRQTHIHCSDHTRDKNTVGTCTDAISVSPFLNHSIDEFSNLYDIEKGTILEMKYLHGDSPSEIWLGFYSDQALHLHLTEIKQRILSGELQQLSSTPILGQYIIGYVDTEFRGSLLSDCGEKLLMLDIDTGEMKLVKKCNVWEIKDCLARFPAQALLCKLKMSNDVQWCSYLRNMFKKCLSNCYLTVTVKEIILDVIPSIVVDIDIHNSTIVDVNLNEWIDIHVSSAVQEYNGSQCASGETFFNNIDPFVIYRKEISCSSSVVSEEDKIHQEDGNHIQNLEEIAPPIIDINHSPQLNADKTEKTNKEFVSDTFQCNTSTSSGKSSEEIKVNKKVIEVCTNNNTIREDTFNTSNSSGKSSEEIKVNEEVMEVCTNNSIREEMQIIDEKVKIVSNVHLMSPRKYFSTFIQCSLEKNSTLEMFYLDGNDPWNFVLHYISKEAVYELKRKVTTKAAGGLLARFPSSPIEGEFAVGKCASEYCRIRITSVPQNDVEKIVAIDIDSAKIIFVSRNDLWVLDEELSMSPAVAYACSLWNIPRIPFHWTKEMEFEFKTIMQNGPLNVVVKDVELLSGNWRHVVQIQMFSDHSFDVSEWIMFHVFPQVIEVKQSSTSKNVSKLIPTISPAATFQKGLNTVGEKIIETDHGEENNERKELFCTVKAKPNISMPSIDKKTCFEKGYKNYHTKETYSKLSIQKPGKGISLDFKKQQISLTPGLKYNAFLSGILTPYEFYVHIISEENLLMDKMHAELESYCTDNSNSFQSKKQAKQLILICCAVFFESQWCRGKILDWLDDSSDEVFVFIVDFGIYSVVPFQSLKCLRSDFYKNSVFAQKCSLTHIAPPGKSNHWPLESLEAFWNILDFNTVYEIYVENYLESIGTLNIFLCPGQGNMESVNDYLIEEGFAIPYTCPQIVEIQEKCHSIMCPIKDSGLNEDFDDENYAEDRYGLNNVEVTEMIPYFDNNTVVLGLLDVEEELTVVITEVINIGSFYAVPDKNNVQGRSCSTSEVLMKMNKKVSSAVQTGQLNPSKQFIVGSIVIARYEKDKNWYRGRLLSTLDDNGYVEVFFVDYGNIDNVHREYVKEITKEFCDLPFQAIRFFIDDINLSTITNKKKEQEAIGVLCKLIGRSPVTVKVMKIVNEDVTVKVFFGGEDIGLKLLTEYQRLCLSCRSN